MPKPATWEYLLTALLALACAAGLRGDELPKSAAVYPLRVSASGRCLVDAQGRPYLVVGDTAWSLIVQLTEDDIADYLDDRRQRGFNSLIVNLIENKFSDRAPSTIAGIPPLLDGDWASPNPTYFDYAHRAIAAAGQRGLSVWLCPAYLGWNGGSEGFYEQIRAAGKDKLRAYGRFIGQRFRDLPNIVWMVGGDYAVPPEQRWVGAELAEAIREGGARQIMTAHGGQTTAVETYGNQPWLAVDTVYRYQEDLWRPLLTNWSRQPILPYVMIESAYEGEHRAAPARIRAQAWWSLTCGACGQFFGNNPIWYFDGPGYTDQKSAPTWRAALNLAGSRDMTQLITIMNELDWPALQPDLDSCLVVSGAGEGGSRITAAASANRRLTLLYVPDTGPAPREFTLNLSSYPDSLQAAWYNPARDVPRQPIDPRLSPRDGVLVRTPGDNGTDAGDWVLIIEADATSKSDTKSDTKSTPESDWEQRTVQGWKVFLRPALLESESDATRRALQLLDQQLTEIVRVVPATAVAELRKVPLYFSPEYSDRPPTAEFHPDAGWLRDHGRDPAMARGVEFTNVRQFEAEVVRMPNFVLHELAHAYHFRFLPEGFANPEIAAAYERAKASQSYDRVERHNGQGRDVTNEKAYAMTDPMEYFAETTEAFFSRNDFFPFTRDELQAHDPKMCALLKKLWGVPE